MTKERSEGFFDVRTFRAFAFYGDLFQIAFDL